MPNEPEQAGRPWIDPDEIRAIMGDEPLRRPLITGARFVDRRPRLRTLLGFAGLVLVAQAIFIAWIGGF